MNNIIEVYMKNRKRERMKEKLRQRDKERKERGRGRKYPQPCPEIIVFVAVSYACSLILFENCLFPIIEVPAEPLIIVLLYYPEGSHTI